MVGGGAVLPRQRGRVRVAAVGEDEGELEGGVTAAGEDDGAKRARPEKTTEAWPEKARRGGSARSRRRTGRGVAAALVLEESQKTQWSACVRLTSGARLEFIVEGPLVPAGGKARD